MAPDCVNRSDWIKHHGRGLGVGKYRGHAVGKRHRHRLQAVYFNHHIGSGLGGAFQSSGYAGICPARRPLPGHAVQFVILQVIGGLLGVWVAHAMLDQEIWQM